MVKGAKLSSMQGMSLVFVCTILLSFLKRAGRSFSCVLDILVAETLVLSSVQVQSIPQWGLCPQWVRRSFRVQMCAVVSPVWLCDPECYSPPGSSVHGILRAGILGWYHFLLHDGIFLHPSLFPNHDFICWIHVLKHNFFSLRQCVFNSRIF